MFKDMMIEVLNKCGEKYGFSVEEAMRECVGELSVSASNDKKAVSSKAKVVREVRAKAGFALPFSYDFDDSLCHAVVQNSGLYTQCESKAISESSGCFCKKHESQAEKSSAGIPEHGTMIQRMEAGLMSYVSPSGKSPTPYRKIMKKLNLSEEQVRAEVSRLNMKFDECHFEDAETKKGRPAKADKVSKEAKQSKGRPKKVKPTVELSEMPDLFSSMVAQAAKEVEPIAVESSSESEDSENEAMGAADKESKVANKAFKKADKTAEKEAKKAALEAEKVAKKLAEEQEKVAKKLAEEQEKEAKKAALEAEKAAKKLAEEQEKEAKKAALEAEKVEKEAKKAALEAEKVAKKAALEAEKVAKKAALEAEKEAKKAAEEAKKAAKKLAEEEKVSKKVEKEPKKKASKKAAEPVAVPEPEPEPAPVVEELVAEEEEEEEEEDVVEPMSFEGVNYLKSTTTGMIYNMEQDEVGQWNAKTSKIDFYEEDDEEEEESDDDQELEPEVCEE